MDVSLAGNGRWEGGGHVFPNPEVLSGFFPLYSVCKSMCGLVTMCLVLGMESKAHGRIEPGRHIPGVPCLALPVLVVRNCQSSSQWTGH